MKTKADILAIMQDYAERSYRLEDMEVFVGGDGYAVRMTGTYVDFYIPFGGDHWDVEEVEFTTWPPTFNRGAPCRRLT